MTKRKFILSVYSEISFGLHSSHKLRMVASFYQEMMDIPMGAPNMFGYKRNYLVSECVSIISGILRNMINQKNEPNN